MTTQEAGQRADRRDLEIIAARKLMGVGLTRLAVAEDDRALQRLGYRLIEAAERVEHEVVLIPVKNSDQVISTVSEGGVAGLIAVGFRHFEDKSKVGNEDDLTDRHRHVSRDLLRTAGLTALSRPETLTDNGIVMTEMLVSVDDLHDKPDAVRQLGSDRYPVHTDPDEQATVGMILREYSAYAASLKTMPRSPRSTIIVNAGHHHELNIR